jgi:hypothetical protein
MKVLILFFIVAFLSLAPTGCQQNPVITTASAPPTASSLALTQSPKPSNTSPPPTGTPTPSATPIPPTATPLPPTATLLPASDSVCASGCDFTTIQAAIDNPDTTSGAIIEVIDPVHTEAGIVVDIDITIRGLGANATIIQAHEIPEQSPERVFHIVEGADVVLEKMTVRHGRPSKQEECGGGIMNHGTLTLDKSVVSDNVSNSGGGICNAGTLTLINSSVSHNTADGIGPVGYTCGAGGGIKCERGSLTLINSTINGNQSEDADIFRDVGRGGGVHIGCKCKGVFTNSTISGNRSVAGAGGIYNHGELQLINCTITDNHTKGEGGGIYVRGHLDYVNTIIAGNQGKGGSCVVGGPGGYRGEGSIGTNSNNLVRGGNCDPAYSDNPLLGPLEDNGGNTLTHALLSSSPAIDAISVISCTLTIDQRTALRPVMLTSPDTPCDIGAFEVQSD